MRPSERRVTLGSVALNCWDSRGLGKALLFLHGNSVSKEEFRPQWDAFGAACRVIVPDLPGHGGSQRLPDPTDYSFPGYAKWLARLLDQLGVRSYVAIGHSLGGHIALELAGSMLPPAALVLSGAPPFRRSAEGMAEAFGADPRGALSFKGELTPEEVRQFCSAVLDGAGDVEYWRRRMPATDPRARTELGRTILSPEVADQRQLAESYGGPVLVINGAEDSFINHGYASTVAYKSLWGGRVHTIAGAGHAPHLNPPGRFNELLAAFLASAPIAW